MRINILLDLTYTHAQIGNNSRKFTIVAKNNEDRLQT